MTVIQQVNVDSKIEVSQAVGVIVRSEIQQGKGDVERRMLSDVEADF